MISVEMPHTGEQSPRVLTERQAKGSADVSGRRDKYACYPACPAHALSERIADDLAVVCGFRVAEARLGLGRRVTVASATCLRSDPTWNEPRS
jgi:hypothetical protein